MCLKSSFGFHGNHNQSVQQYAEKTSDQSDSSCYDKDDVKMNLQKDIAFRRKFLHSFSLLIDEFVRKINNCQIVSQVFENCLSFV